MARDDRVAERAGNDKDAPGDDAQKKSEDDEDEKPSGAKADTSEHDDGNAADKKDESDKDDKDEDTPEQRYQARFPQSVKVSDVVGKPMISTDNGSLGTVRAMVRSRDGKIRLIVPYGGVLGFGRRSVAVPLEVVGSIGTAIVSLDMDRKAFDAAPTWVQQDETVLAPDAPVGIAIARH